ncbi:hypothetical protein AGIG_G6267 [Arapaima gigas]
MVRRGTSSKARLPDTVADDRRFPSSVQVPLGSLLGPEGTRILSCAARRVENTEALSSPAVGSEKPRQAAKMRAGTFPHSPSPSLFVTGRKGRLFRDLDDTRGRPFNPKRLRSCGTSPSAAEQNRAALSFVLPEDCGERFLP